jgi:hypothetical protein
MAITYTWSIPNCEREIATGGIKVIHWRCTGVDGEDVTQEIAQGWVWEHISQTDVEALVASEIEKQKNVTEGSGLPWE